MIPDDATSIHWARCPVCKRRLGNRPLPNFYNVVDLFLAEVVFVVEAMEGLGLQRWRARSQAVTGEAGEGSSSSY